MAAELGFLAVVPSGHEVVSRVDVVLFVSPVPKLLLLSEGSWRVGGVEILELLITPALHC